jgi:hypothetical protein
MVGVGTLASQFACSAWIRGQVRRLSWSEPHIGNMLVLLFDPEAARLYDELYELNQAACRMGAHTDTAAVVCHGPVRMIEDRAAGTLARGEALAFMVIVDPEDDVAAPNDLVSVHNAACWRQIIIDTAGLGRQVEISTCRIGANADERVRFVGGITNIVIGNRNHLEEEK